MADFVLVDKDQVNFMSAFGAALVAVRPGQLTGSGPTTIQNKKVCVQGDEATVQVPGCTYTAGAYTIPGTGTLKILQLAADQVATHKYSGNKRVLLKGSMFTAKFEVQSPAQQPAPPGPNVPDPMVMYTGQGSFVNSNLIMKAT